MKKVLFVDGATQALSGLQRVLRKRFDIEVTLDGEQGLFALESGEEFGALVMDWNMPGMSGNYFLKKARELGPKVAQIVITGPLDEPGTTVPDKLEGVFKVMHLPCTPDSMAECLSAALEPKAEAPVDSGLAAKTLEGCVRLLTEVMGASDPAGLARTQKLRELSVKLARELGWENTWELETAAMLLRIGNSAVPPEIVARAITPSQLTEGEREILERVPEFGAHLLEYIPKLEPVAAIVRFQEKGFDGSGAPKDGVAGESIPAGARIIRVLADMLRLEAGGLNREEALGRMSADMAWYDPKILEAAKRCLSSHVEEEGGVEIPFRELRPGMVLISNLVSREGLLIASAGVQISPTMLERLRGFSKLNGIREPIHVRDPHEKS